MYWVLQTCISCDQVYSRPSVAETILPKGSLLLFPKPQLLLLLKPKLQRLLLPIPLLPKSLLSLLPKPQMLSFLLTIPPLLKTQLLYLPKSQIPLLLPRSPLPKVQLSHLPKPQVPSLLLTIPPLSQCYRPVSKYSLAITISQLDQEKFTTLFIFLYRRKEKNKKISYPLNIVRNRKCLINYRTFLLKVILPPTKDFICINYCKVGMQ